jgi:hypothetical protein
MQAGRDPVGDSEAEQRDTQITAEWLPLRTVRPTLWLEQVRVFPCGETAQQWITGTEPTAQD